MTVDLETLVHDGVVRVGKSLYPVNVSVGDDTVLAARFMLFDDGGSWVAGLWAKGPQGEPYEVFVEPVFELVTVAMRRIAFVLTDGRSVAVTPSSACGGCGARLRSYNPFGAGVSLAAVPTPVVDP